MEMKVTNAFLDAMAARPNPSRIHKIVGRSPDAEILVKDTLNRMGAEYSAFKGRGNYWCLRTDVDRQTFYDLLTDLVTVD